MADGDVERTKTLLSNFDYEYADRYLDVNPQAYVDRNKGLKIRREEEYNMFINGIL